MRILVITNYYPPSMYGWGYMQLCEEVTDGLADRGHEIAVLTSTHCDGPEPVRPYPVHRLLHIDPDWNRGTSAAWQFFMGRKQREQEALEHLNVLLEQVDPQVVFVWHASGLPRALLQAVEAQRERAVVYYFADYLPELPDEHIAYWQAEPVHPLARMFKRPLAGLALRQLEAEGKPIALDYSHAICVSHYVRQRLVSAGLIPSSAVVIHNGVDLSVFSAGDHQRHVSDGAGLRCLVAGRVIADKGIHTIVEALGRLGPGADISLTILGDGPAGYAQRLREQVRAYHLENQVFFETPIPRSAMPAKLAEYDVLLLASEYAEPIARSMQEAMAMGALVIGTTTGGSGELLIHGETGLVFEAGDADSLAQQFQRALDEPELVTALAAAGQERVRQEFNITRTVDRIETYLQRLLELA